MIGIDLCEIARMEKHVHNAHFHRRILTERELRAYFRRPNAENLAGYFTAKEAASKAIGMGIGKIGWKDIEISHSPLGQPRATIRDRHRNLVHKIAISITHDGDYAAASAQLLETWTTAESDMLWEMKALLPDRPADAHKGTMGRVAIVGGSTGMTGSIWLSSMAALRTGAGLSYALIPKDALKELSAKLIEPIAKPLLQKDPYELISFTRGMDGMAIGPGMGTCDIARKSLVALMLEKGCPLVLDADALNLCAKEPVLLQNAKRKLIMTPHKGELARLIGETTDENASEFAKKYGIILINKGPNTTVTDGDRTWGNETGNDGMATAGTGDVLTGVVASFLAQGVPAWDAARLGVYVHGLAGDLAANEIGKDGMIASDIVRFIPKAIKTIREA